MLVDLGLPGCSEMEALLKFRAAFPDTPVAVISATEDAGRVNAALEAGAAGYLPKTLLPKTMASALRAILDGQVYSPLAEGRAA